MKPHKWTKEIKAWADGAEIEYREYEFESWKTNSSPNWDGHEEFRIKPQPKEPQYLYVTQGDDGKPSLSFLDHQGCIGKIKLEPDNESV